MLRFTLPRLIEKASFILSARSVITKSDDLIIETDKRQLNMFLPNAEFSLKNDTSQEVIMLLYRESDKPMLASITSNSSQLGWIPVLSIM